MITVAFDTTISARPITGVGVYARELGEALRHHSDVVLREWRRSMAPPGPRLNRLLNGARVAAWFGAGVAAGSWRHRIDVYHSTTSLGPLAARCPIIMTVHDATLVTMPVYTGLADRIFRRAFTIEAARRADAILAPTEFSVSAIADGYGVPRHRIRLVPLGVSPGFAAVTCDDTRRVRSQYGLDRPYVLYVGAEPPRKNLPRLVRAFAEVRARNADLQLVLAGPPAPRDLHVDEVVDRLTLRSDVRRLGAVPRSDLPGLYAGACCTAVVSTCEGFGFPIVEAMAAGSPVVASNCTALPEVAGDAAVLVDPFSVDAIAGGIESVLNDTVRAADLRRRGRARSQVFSWTRTADLTRQVYRDVAG